MKHWKKQHIRRFKFWLKKVGKKDMFDAVNLEISTACNRKCAYCPNSIFPRGEIKNQRLMDLELINKILDELGKLNFKGKINTCHYNEPLLDKRLPEIAKLIKQKVPKCKLIINSNGDYLTEELENNLKKSGVDKISVSEHKDPNYKFNPMNNRCGLVNPINLDLYPRCLFDTIELIIDVDGNVKICCNDYIGENIMGNLNKQSIVEIWNSELFVKTRKDLRDWNFSLPMCKRCLNENTNKK
ncbi:MAG: radical SAM/SPASM domain-containing protein [Candidatus Pacearchaeota archaeon]|jgi:radical SAM protein with 4Fe4S-binding SPASM domain